MRTVVATGLLIVALAGCGASEEEVTAQVRAVEEPLTEQLAAKDQEIERLHEQVAAGEVALREADRRARGAEVRAKQAAEQALAPQKAEVARQAAALEAQEAALLAREKAVGTAEAQAAANTVDGDGTYIVGDDIQPGRTSRLAAAAATGRGLGKVARTLSITTSPTGRRS